MRLAFVDRDGFHTSPKIDPKVFFLQSLSRAISCMTSRIKKLKDNKKVLPRTTKATSLTTEFASRFGNVIEKAASDHKEIHIHVSVAASCVTFLRNPR